MAEPSEACQLLAREIAVGGDVFIADKLMDIYFNKYDKTVDSITNDDILLFIKELPTYEDFTMLYLLDDPRYGAIAHRMEILEKKIERTKRK